MSSTPRHSGGGGSRRGSGVIQPERRRSSIHQNAESEAALAKLGYVSELPRNLSMMSILGLSFAIMAVPFGLSTTLYITLTDGQSVTVLYGWLFVSLISLAIASSLAEICSVYPTAVSFFLFPLYYHRFRPLRLFFCFILVCDST